ncbi:hypothetical protein HMPREF1544_00987 [Mucor circinelloides 1006PhL]|uniref:Restriction of telomere capping protein 4 n=1 Tax=Mucor circinelloides f. circinelloides (strain 1006PhL) TaxID=1220926 RepID=S2JUP4_MUCC1|nr:hypothetical protein HMPREF1544_00987 [Mucor circinelloides 1006PhL]
MESSNKRPAQTTPQRPDVKKSKTIDKKDTCPPPAKKEPVSVNSTRGNKLVLPKRRAKPLEKKEVISEAIIQEVKEGKLPDKKECFDCPDCGESIFPPYPPKLHRLIKKLKQNQIQYEKEQRAAYELEVIECKRNNMFIKPFILQDVGLSKNDKRVICRTHQIELKFKPMAKEKGYPEHIDFDAIADRIDLFQDELLGIIERKVSSTYLDAAYCRFEKMGVKARSAKEMLAVFEDFKPGYYGVKGTDAIMQALFSLFLETSLITINNVKPLTPIEFIQQILVPEAGLRLIRQDRGGKVDLEEAKRIMKESEEYGSIVYYKVKKDKNMPDEKEIAKIQQQDEHGEEQPNEYISFPMPSNTEEEEDDENESEDILSSQLSMVSQVDEFDDQVSSQTPELQD